MLSEELIALLQESDPTGKTEVSIGNRDVFFIERKPAYWDGSLQRIILDKTKPNYNVVGAKVIHMGDKLEIHIMGISDAIENEVDIPVDLSDLSGNTLIEWQKKVESLREETTRINREVDEEMQLRKL